MCYDLRCAVRAHLEDAADLGEDRSEDGEVYYGYFNLALALANASRDHALHAESVKDPNRLILIHEADSDADYVIDLAAGQSLKDFQKFVPKESLSEFLRESIYSVLVEESSGTENV